MRIVSKCRTRAHIPCMCCIHADTRTCAHTLKLHTRAAGPSWDGANSKAELSWALLPHPECFQLVTLHTLCSPCGRSPVVLPPSLLHLGVYLLIIYNLLCRSDVGDDWLHPHHLCPALWVFAGSQPMTTRHSAHAFQRENRPGSAVIRWVKMQKALASDASCRWSLCVQGCGLCWEPCRVWHRVVHQSPLLEVAPSWKLPMTARELLATIPRAAAEGTLSPLFWDA